MRWPNVIEIAIKSPLNLYLIILKKKNTQDSVAQSKNIRKVKIKMHMIIALLSLGQIGPVQHPTPLVV